jgi:hypothetical protein
MRVVSGEKGVKYQIDKEYYVRKKPELIKRFEKEVKYWSPVIFSRYGEIQGYKILSQTRQNFENLIPKIPYIGGDTNRRTEILVQSVQFLAFYQVMKENGKTAEETGMVLFKALTARLKKTPEHMTPSGWQNRKQYYQIRREGAESSQRKLYPGDYVYTFILDDGKKFDYGYNYSECATVKFFHEQNADEFMPFYCYLDYPICAAKGLGLTRTMTLGQGNVRCNHRFTPGKATKLVWPPPFLKRKPFDKLRVKR